MIISSVTQLCLTLCNPMDCSMPGFPVRHQLLELAQTHVHQVSDTVADAIKPSHPLSSPSPPALSQSFLRSFFFFLIKKRFYSWFDLRGRRNVSEHKIELLRKAAERMLTAFKLCFKGDTTYFHSFSLSSNFKVKRDDFEIQPRWHESCH